jgi:hypothetical protein
MQDAGYLRAQAKLCLQMAHESSDEAIAGNLRAVAAQYFSRVLEVERPLAAAPPNARTP